MKEGERLLRRKEYEDSEITMQTLRELEGLAQLREYHDQLVGVGV